MKKLLALVLACVALGVVAAGCGGDDDSGGGSSGGGGGGASKPASGGGAKSGAQVTMKDIKFNPSSVTVKKGGTVTWTNDDSVGHDVTADSFKSGGAGGIQGGQSFKHKFTQAGTFDYVCTVHPGMKGTVKVQ